MVERGPEKAGVGSSILLLGIKIFLFCNSISCNKLHHPIKIKFLWCPFCAHFRLRESKPVERLLTPQQLSDLLQVKLSTVYKWAHYRYVPCVKLGSLVRFKSGKIEEWIKKRERKGRGAYKCKAL